MLSGGGGSGATAVALIDGDAVKQIIITSTGRGYTTAPSVLVEAPLDARLQKLWTIDESVVLAGSSDWVGPYGGGGLGFDNGDRFGSDGSALISYVSQYNLTNDYGYTGSVLQTNLLLWASTNGIAIIRGYTLAAEPKYISSSKFIALVYQDNPSGQFRALLQLLIGTRAAPDLASLESVDLSALRPDPSQPVTIDSWYDPEAKPTREFFTVQLGNPTKLPHKFGFRIGYRILDPVFSTTVTVGPPAAPAQLQSFGVHNTGGGVVDVQTSPDLRSWHTVAILPNAPSDFTVTLPVTTTTNIFLRTAER